MPLYDLHCKKCNTTEEVMCKYSQIPQQKCSVCQGELERLVSKGVGMELKGKDWPGKAIKELNSAHKEAGD